MSIEFENLNNIAAHYLRVIEAFKKRTDVLNGTAIGYHDGQDPNGKLRLENKPHSIGEGLTTTGYCVSASQALLYDNAFKILLENRNAKAKLVSIDIKEQFWGSCYNNVKNTWHTAILVNDSNINFIIDLTCAQFGNRYIEKFIWNFETWESTFRSATCKHIITDFNGNVLSFQCKPSERYTVNDEKLDNIKYNLSKIVLLNEEEISFLADYLIKRFKDLNSKLLLGNINSIDNKYISKLNNILRKLPFVNYEKPQYSIMKFTNKKSCLKYIENLHKNGYKSNCYMFTSDNIENICQKQNIKSEELNKDCYNDNSDFYLIWKIKNLYSISLKDIISDTDSIIPFGIEFELDMSNGGIYNASKLKNIDSFGVEPQKTNTIYIDCNLM